ncbi:MAG: hypothetical protein M0P11_08220 [Anaerolineaceae bacterium]|nr:hypothetical protein [Anaerolineaceae bacterium]
MTVINLELGGSGARARAVLQWPLGVVIGINIDSALRGNNEGGHRPTGAQTLSNVLVATGF